jgi:hypothetical protein
MLPAMDERLDELKARLEQLQAHERLYLEWADGLPHGLDPIRAEQDGVRVVPSAVRELFRAVADGRITAWD